MASVMKPRNDYVSFRPYQAIGSTRSGWASGDGPVRTTLQAGATALLVIGAPSLIIVPGLVYYLVGFKDWPTFLGHTVATFLFPAAAIGVITLLAAIFSVARLFFRR